MSSAASSVSCDFVSFKILNIPSSSIMVFCGTGIYRIIDVRKKRMLRAVIESFVRRSSCFSCCIIFEISDDESVSFLGFSSFRASTFFLVVVNRCVEFVSAFQEKKSVSRTLCFRHRLIVATFYRGVVTNLTTVVSSDLISLFISTIQCYFRRIICKTLTREQKIKCQDFPVLPRVSDFSNHLSSVNDCSSR